MNGHKFVSGNKQDLDILLSNAMAELPPTEDIAKRITPWRKSIGCVLWGMALSIISFDFLWLGYLLPAIGFILMLLGFRTLQRENPWFRACWIISIFRTGCFFSMLILYAAIWQEKVCELSCTYMLSYADAAAALVLILCLRKSFSSAQKKAEIPKHVNGFNALIIWYLALLALIFMQYSSGLLGVLLILSAYGMIMRSLLRLPSELDKAGYSIHAAPVKVSDHILALVLSAALILGIGAGYCFFNQYPMDWEIASSEEAEGLETIRARLLALGFPEDVLGDLSSEDIADCGDALRVIVSRKEHPVSGERVITCLWDITHYQYQTYDTPELRITSAAVELPGEQGQWKIFHHFEWIVNPDLYGTEAIQIQPSYGRYNCWEKKGDISGRILYDDNGLTYTALYYSLEENAEEYQQYNLSFFSFGNQTSTDIFAEFSFPAGKERYRGYLSYSISEVSDSYGYLIDSGVNYIHQRSRLQYPVRTAAGFWKNVPALPTNRIFHTIYDALQFKPYLPDAEAWQ